MQIVQELCKRPGLNRTGFDMPTIYVPNSSGKVSNTQFICCKHNQNYYINQGVIIKRDGSSGFDIYHKFEIVFFMSCLHLERFSLLSLFSISSILKYM